MTETSQQQTDLVFRIEEAGDAVDPHVCKHWRSMWLEAGMPESEFVTDFNERTQTFISNAREELEYKTFAAYTPQNELVASVSCQVWTGTMPNACVDTKVGTMWAVYVKPEYRRRGIATNLVQSCIEHWRSIGCTSAVLIYASDAGRRIYERQGFQKDILLFHELPSSRENTKKTQEWKVTPAERRFDPVLINNWRKVWLESGKPAQVLREDVAQATSDFITRARNALEFQSFVARDVEGNVIGSAACQTWEGPLPLVIEQRSFKFGSIWGVYVDPAHRGKGIGKALIQCCNEHLFAIGCKRSITLAASEDSAAWLRNCGFDPSNAMTLTLSKDAAFDASAMPAAQLPADVTVEAVEHLRRAAPQLAGSGQRRLGWLLRANANQLRALQLASEDAEAVVRVQKSHGLWLDPQNNWFTRNVKRFGKGFDMEQLGKDRALLAAKFDRLSPNYEAWTLGNRSVVEDWVAATFREAAAEGVVGPCSHVLDVACGAGLMGHAVRMLGYDGMLSGVDISQGMVEEARGRRCYDVLWAEDVRNGVGAEAGCADVVLCTGAMELLDARAALTELRRVLRPDGELWVSFQLDVGGPDADSDKAESTNNPTAHQNVQGMRLPEIELAVQHSGFEIRALQACPAAFYTPAPVQDGTMMPVPYAFLRCVRR